LVHIRIAVSFSWDYYWSILQNPVGVNLGNTDVEGVKDLMAKGEFSLPKFVTRGSEKCVESMANNEILQLVIFRILWSCLTHIGKKGEPVIKRWTPSRVMLKMVGYVMQLTPRCVRCHVCSHCFKGLAS
jgi:Na+/H+-dicarboxylate symporter